VSVSRLRVGLLVFAIASTGGVALEAAIGGSVINALSAASLISYAVVGALILAAHPRHAIGWILLGAGVGFGVFTITDRYATAAHAHPGLPFGPAVESLSQASIFPLSVLVLVSLFVLFPDGRAPSRRWRRVLWVTLALALLSFAQFLLTPGRPSGSIWENPFGLPGVAGAAVSHASPAVEFLAVAMLVPAVGGMVARLRRSRGVERQQYKWIASGSVAVAFAFACFLPFAGTTSTAQNIALGLVIVAMAMIPVTIGIAVLRYRLYEIDVIVRKTLVYGALTVVLGAVYLGGVVVLGGAVRSLTGQSNALVVTLSTLGVAALFRPLLGRIQALVDRRFYRGRYDGARALQAFAGRLREEVDLGEVEHEVHGVLAATVQPASASLWLRDRTGSAG
jgi:hypothetical protein